MKIGGYDILEYHILARTCIKHNRDDKLMLLEGQHASTCTGDMSPLRLVVLSSFTPSEQN